LSDPLTYPLSLSQVEDAGAVIQALEQAIRPFIEREGGITYPPVLHALSAFLVAQAVAAEEPLAQLLYNLQDLHADCLLQYKKSHPKGLFRG
jgi:hypothetical protein